VSWRLAKSLAVLRDQVDTLAPKRSKATDGTIGDIVHAQRHSRHNPNHAGVVCALDLTDDPDHGCAVHRIAEHVVARPHPDLDYVISNRRVAGRSTGWAWHRYTGANPHTDHAHFGVGTGPEPLPGERTPRPPFDDVVKWAIAGEPAKPPVDSRRTPRTLRRGSTGADVRGLQLILIGAHLLPAGSDDGICGPGTDAAVRRLQRQLGLAPDGVVGDRTHAAIAKLLAFLAALATAL
jgi:hypothetical protein